MRRRGVTYVHTYISYRLLNAAFTVFFRCTVAYLQVLPAQNPGICIKGGGAVGCSAAFQAGGLGLGKVRVGPPLHFRFRLCLVLYTLVKPRTPCVRFYRKTKRRGEGGLGDMGRGERAVVLA